MPYFRIFDSSGTAVTDDIKAYDNTDNFDPKISVLSNGYFIIHYERIVNNQLRVSGQIFESNGTKHGAEFQVTTNTIAGTYGYKEIAGLKNCSFASVFGTSDTSGRGVYGRITTNKISNCSKLVNASDFTFNFSGEVNATADISFKDYVSQTGVSNYSEDLRILITALPSSNSSFEVQIKTPANCNDLGTCHHYNDGYYVAGYGTSCMIVFAVIMLKRLT